MLIAQLHTGLFARDLYMVSTTVEGSNMNSGLNTSRDYGLAEAVISTERGPPSRVVG